MAMVYCRECGKQIFDQASICPHCGAPRDLQQPQQPGFGQPVQPVYVVQPVKPKIPGRGFSIASLVLGIIAVYYAFGYLMISLVTPIVSHATSAMPQRLDEYGNLTSEHAEVAVDIINTGMSVAILSMFVFTFILGALALIFGVASHQKGCKLKKKVAGITMGTITIVISLACTAINFFVL